MTPEHKMMSASFTMPMMVYHSCSHFDGSAFSETNLDDSVGENICEATLIALM